MVQELKAVQQFSKNIDEILKKSPLKMEYVLDMVGLSRMTFYRKKKEGSFTVSELVKISEILYPVETYELELRSRVDDAKKQYANGKYKSHEEVMAKYRSR